MHLIIGQIVRPHGIRGEVLVDVRTDAPEARFTVGAALATSTGGDTQPGVPSGSGAAGVPESLAEEPEAEEPVRWRVPARLTIEGVRAHQGRLLVTFDGVYDRDMADELRGVLLWVDSGELAQPADPDEFHDFQLVGLTAVTPAGETLGAVARIDHAPASDLLVVRRPAGGTALVPFVKEIVPEVDLAAGRVIIDPPGGLFDL